MFKFIQNLTKRSTKLLGSFWDGLKRWWGR